ncbi:MAG: hypothetical protein K0S55_1451, partial [Clostridia bacterium]|nr:hypothetical protein [Clostridia bacterium]
DWNRQYYNEIKWGICNSVSMCLEVIKKNDETVLSVIKECIDIIK